MVSWQKSEYPGVAQLVGRDIWDVEVGCSSHLTRTKIPLKSTISEGFSYSLSIAAQDLREISPYSCNGRCVRLYEYEVAENLEICYYKLKNIRRSEVPQ